MNNNYSYSYYFRFSPVQTFGYSSRDKYAAGWLDVDEKGNAKIQCNNYSYCNYYELFGWLACNFQEEYFYRRTNISFYGKNTRSIKIGRTSISVSAENKINVNGEYFIPDLILALRIISMYDNIKPYGFNRKFHFVGKTSKEILDFFEVNFTSYIMRGEELKEAKNIPSSKRVWEVYLNNIKNEYKEREWEHSHCVHSNDYGYVEDNYNPVFKDVNYTFPITFKIVDKIGVLVTKKGKEYNILEIKARDPRNNFTFGKEPFIVYVPKDKGWYVYTYPEFEKYEDKNRTFHSILEATVDYCCNILKKQLDKNFKSETQEFLSDCRKIKDWGWSNPFAYSYEYNTKNIHDVLIYNDEWSCKTQNLSL